MTPREQKRDEWKVRLQALQAASEDSADAVLVSLDEPEETLGPLFDKFQEDLGALVTALREAAAESPTELAEEYRNMMPRFSQGCAFLAYTVVEYRRRHHPKPSQPAA